MDNRPVGIFDSGLGGLTAVREMRRILPGEKIVFFGDTARVPYGSRSSGIILQFSKEDIGFLLEHGVKAILCACGTATSMLPKEYTDTLPVPFAGVVAAASKAAVRATKNRRIGLIATEASVRSASYERAILDFDSGIRVFGTGCPKLVPLIEGGHIGRSDPLLIEPLREYLQPLKDSGVDTLILGCTHYPIIAQTVADIMGSGVVLIDSGAEGARALMDTLAARDLLRDGSQEGTVDFYFSDSGESFRRAGAVFLGKDAEGTVHPFALGRQAAGI